MATNLGYYIRSPSVNIQGTVSMGNDLAIEGNIAVVGEAGIGTLVDIGQNSGNVNGVEVFRAINNVAGTGVGSCGINMTFMLPLDGNVTESFNTPITAANIAVCDADPADSIFKSRILFKTRNSTETESDPVTQLSIDGDCVTIGSTTTASVNVVGSLFVDRSANVGTLNVSSGAVLSGICTVGSGGGVVLGSSLTDTVSVAGPMLFQVGAAPFLKRRAVGTGVIQIGTSDIGGIVAITTGASTIPVTLSLPNTTNGWVNGTHVGYFYIMQEIATTVPIIISAPTGSINGASTIPLQSTNPMSGGSAFTNKFVMVYPTGSGTTWWARGSGVQ